VPIAPRPLLLLLVLSALSGCNRAVVIPDENAFRIVGGDQANTINTAQQGVFARLVDRLLKERVIYLGERHNVFGDHQLQLAILNALHQRGRKLAIGVEWFQRPFQQHLDDFVAGKIDEAEMLRRTEYFGRWGVDYRHYRAILHFAQDKGIPLIALNAPSELVYAIRTGGIISLDELLASQLPEEYYFTNTKYKNRLRTIYKQHKGYKGPFKYFYEVQLTWDETMAEQVARHLNQEENSVLVVLAGNGHLEYGDGIPDRVERLTNILGPIILPWQPEFKDAGIADYLINSPDRLLTERGQLGATLQSSQQQVRILAIDAGGPAQRAGLRTDDILVMIDGKAIHDLTDLKLSLLEKLPGTQVAIEVERSPGGNSRHTLTLTAPTPSAKAHGGHP
jgi:uncharacterized iron-regulated protein